MIWVVDVRRSISLAATSLFCLLAVGYLSIYLPTWADSSSLSVSLSLFFCSYTTKPSGSPPTYLGRYSALIRFASFGSCLSAAFLRIALFGADIAVLSLCCNYSNMPAKFAVHSAIPTQPPLHHLKIIPPVLQLLQMSTHPAAARPTTTTIHST